MKITYLRVVEPISGLRYEKANWNPAFDGCTPGVDGDWACRLLRVVLFGLQRWFERFGVFLRERRIWYWDWVQRRLLRTGLSTLLSLVSLLFLRLPVLSLLFSLFLRLRVARLFGLLPGLLCAGLARVWA